MEDMALATELRKKPYDLASFKHIYEFVMEGPWSFGHTLRLLWILDQTPKLIEDFEKTKAALEWWNKEYQLAGPDEECDPIEALHAIDKARENKLKKALTALAEIKRAAEVTLIPLEGDCDGSVPCPECQLKLMLEIIKNVEED
jgi:hypothetical protein